MGADGVDLGHGADCTFETRFRRCAEQQADAEYAPGAVPARHLDPDNVTYLKLWHRTLPRLDTATAAVRIAIAKSIYPPSWLPRPIYQIKMHSGDITTTICTM